ncbi:MAG: hypothetical protein IPM35_00020 [Myxococcales bacterium]|nr:hypothetical protein [Myxococcales bacterium]
MVSKLIVGLAPELGLDLVPLRASTAWSFAASTSRSFLSAKDAPAFHTAVVTSVPGSIMLAFYRVPAVPPTGSAMERGPCTPHKTPVRYEKTSYRLTTMDTGVKRLARMLAGIGAARAAPGLREMFALLNEERARRFIAWLADPDMERTVPAERVISDLLHQPHGERILRHVVRDVFFGTETVSLAALAFIAAQASLRAEDEFLPRAARAVDGLANDDAAFFLCLMSQPTGVSVLAEERPVCVFSPSSIHEAAWEAQRTVCGFSENQAIASIAELTRRRLFLPDTAGARLGGGKAFVCFGVIDDSLRFYDLLYRALRVAETEVFSSIGIRSVEDMDRLWAKYFASSGDAGSANAGADVLK